MDGLSDLCFDPGTKFQELVHQRFGCSASAQLSELQGIVNIRDWDAGLNDSWSYIWGPKFTSKKAYNHLQGIAEASPLFRWIWKAGNLEKHKFFAWLLIKDRLSTRNILKRKNMYLEDYSCVLCSSGLEETCFHLFFECPFSQDCWHSINIHWDLSLPPLDMIIQARSDFGSPTFREIFITACWIIWKSRNGVIFDNKAATLLNWRADLKMEIGLVCIKAKRSIANPLLVWRDSCL